jgi:predicted AAA+ superfamily ATPase
LDDQTYRNLLRQPNLLAEAITDPKQIVVIDEIQRIPDLLNEVQRLLFQKKGRFLLTGSSARKLKHGAANLLGGRAWEANLFPLTSAEIHEFSLLQLLNRGGLPEIYQSQDFKKDLASYVSLYLQQEIKAEALTRNVQGFSEFLDLAAHSNGNEINYESFAADCQVSTSTIKNYFQILEDTLIGFRVRGFTKTRKRKAISRAKHYLFDLGVTNALSKRWIEDLDSANFGQAFEHFIALELRAYLKYRDSTKELNYWRSVSKIEVDFVVHDDAAIEVKATHTAADKHLRSLRALKEENLFRRHILVSRDDMKRITPDGIEIYPYHLFLKELWSGQILSD